jgi:hypothetical protein
MLCVGIDSLLNLGGRGGGVVYFLGFALIVSLHFVERRGLEGREDQVLDSFLRVLAVIWKR